jgi:DNA sulfur modification protein DndB
MTNAPTAAYVFPAVRGIQAQREFYVIMCPLDLVPRICTFTHASQPPEMRRQRILNKARVPAIARYIVNNPSNYVLSALTASADVPIDFQPAADPWPQCNAGTVTVPATARFLLNDGQHRRAAIEAALREEPELAKESIPIVLFWDAGLKRSQQMFADLNTHAVKPSRSLSVLFDHRNSLSVLCHSMLESVEMFVDRVERERATIPNRSKSLFTLSAIYHATARLLNASSEDPLNDDDKAFAIEYWNIVATHIPQWVQLRKGEVMAWELRRGYIHSHGIGLQALGRLGFFLRRDIPATWREVLVSLEDVDWSRSNAQLWEGRAMIGGRMSNSAQNVILTCNALKRHVGLEFTNEEKRAEEVLMASRRGESGVRTAF